MDLSAAGRGESARRDMDSAPDNLRLVLAFVPMVAAPFVAIAAYRLRGGQMTLRQWALVIAFESAALAIAVQWMR